MLRPSALLSLLTLPFFFACNGTSSTDAGPDADVIAIDTPVVDTLPSDTIVDTEAAVCVPNVPQSTGPGSTAALLDSLCAGRPRTGTATEFSAYSGTPVNTIDHTAPGDFEAVHLPITAPVRIESIRMYVKGGAGGQMRIHITDDYGRSQPAIANDLSTITDLIAPITITWTADGWVDIPLCEPLDLHPVRQAWVVAEHVTEPMGLAFAPSSGVSERSFFAVWYYILMNEAMPSADSTAQWFEIADSMGNVYEYMVEVYGELICPNTAPAWFTDVTAASGVLVQTGDSNWTDIDGDGWDDVAGVLQTTTHEGPEIFRNQHDGTFLPYAPPGLDQALGRVVEYADWDGDGHVDLYSGVYVAGLPPFTPPFQSSASMQTASGDFTLVDSNVEPDGPTAAAAIADCDGDGHLDLFVGQWDRTYPTDPAPSYLFHGNGDGTFEDVTASSGFPAAAIYPTYGAMFADWNNDGYPDLFVAHYGGSLNYAYRNDGHCHLTSVGVPTHIASDGPGTAGISFGFEFGDYDNDGNLDTYETDIAHPRYDVEHLDHSRLLHNGGPPDYTFTNVTQSAGILYTEGEISSAWGDFDNDGDLDLYVSITYPYEYSRLYAQGPTGFFTDVTYLSGMSTEINGRGRWCDYDRDGDLDFLTAPNGQMQLFRNDTPQTNHWLEVRLTATGFNPEALGARIIATSSDGIHRMRDVNGTESHHGSQGPHTQHFGFGASTDPVDLEVHWPDGTMNTYSAVGVDHLIGIVEGEMPLIIGP